MKKNKPKYIKYFYKWLKEGLPRGRGLCAEFNGDLGAEDLLYNVAPTDKDFIKLERLGFDLLHWGSDATHKSLGDFTPLRQNLVLLMAALNNEL